MQLHFINLRNSLTIIQDFSNPKYFFTLQFAWRILYLFIIFIKLLYKFLRATRHTMDWSTFYECFWLKDKAQKILDYIDLIFNNFPILDGSLNSNKKWQPKWWGSQSVNSDGFSQFCIIMIMLRLCFLFHVNLAQLTVCFKPVICLLACCCLVRRVFSDVSSKLSVVKEVVQQFGKYNNQLSWQTTCFLQIN